MSIYPTDWTGVDESLYRLAERLRIMYASRLFGVDGTSSWTEQGRKKGVKRLKVLVEARFLFAQLTAEKVDLGSFLSKFREVGDVVFVPQKTRRLNEDESDGLVTSPPF